MKKNTNVDGVNINTEHFGPMTKAEATQRMLDDGMCLGKDDKAKKEWASKAYDLVKAEYDKPEEPVAVAPAPKATEEVKK
jgi:hypothetical protein